MARKTTVKTETAKSAAAKVETAKTETVKADAVKAAPVKIDAVKTDVVKTDAVKADVVKADVVKAEPTAATAAPRAKAVKAKPATSRSVFSLQHVPGATVLAETVGNGLVMTPKLKPGCTVAISYLKDVERPLTAARLHARIDGVPVAAAELGHTDAEGRFVRTPFTLDLAPTAQKLEYWFELKTSDGETLWDSNWGRNHWLEVEGAAAEAQVARS